MTEDHKSDLTRAARDYAGQAASVASKLRPGSYDSVQALALLSIAHSLLALTDEHSAR